MDRSFSFTLSRDREQLTDVRIKVRLECFKVGDESRDHFVVRERTLHIPAVPLSGLRTAEPYARVDGLQFTGSFKLDPPRGPWLFEGYAEPGTHGEEIPDPEDPAGGRCTGGGHDIAKSGFDWAVNGCVRRSWNRVVRRAPKRERARAKQRLVRRCSAAASRQFPLPPPT